MSNNKSVEKIAKKVIEIKDPSWYNKSNKILRYFIVFNKSSKIHIVSNSGESVKLNFSLQ